jgi:glycosyltransferase involved in cell wall biosynthesis
MGIEKVSVVMCTCNGEKYLKEQMDSILRQTYPVHEIIIQDDCSTDGTFSLLTQYAQKHPLIKLSQNQARKGINKNFFSAMEQASGDYIAIADQDDIWVPRKIEEQLKYIGDSLLCAGITRPFADDTGVGIHIDGRIPNLYPERIIYISMIAGHTMLLRKELIKKIPDPDYWSQFFMYDHLIQIIAASYEKIRYCPFVLVCQRKHTTSATYAEPYNYKKSIANICSSALRTLKLYRRIRLKMRDYFKQVYVLLDTLNVSASSDNAKKLAYFHASSFTLDFITLSFLCVKLRSRIFHAKENNPVLAILRSLYFPISCSDYFRYMKGSI